VACSVFPETCLFGPTLNAFRSCSISKFEFELLNHFLLSIHAEKRIAVALLRDKEEESITAIRPMQD
jgi:hypothetical protein